MSITVQAITALVVKWEIACAAVVLYTVIMIALSVFARMIESTSTKQQKNDHAPKLAVEIIENTKTVQLLTREKYFLQKYATSLNSTYKYDKCVSNFDFF